MDLLGDTRDSTEAATAQDTGGADASLAFLFDELAHGIVVIDVHGVMLHANLAAQHELARARVLHLSAGSLQACTPCDARLLQEAVAKAASGRRSLIELSAAGAAPLSVAVLPVKPVQDRASRIALLFARVSVCDSLMLSFFARKHALTAAEEHVLGILCQGMSAPQIAAQLKVAVSTVRSHVRSMCAKTRTSGVRELVNRVAVLPPVAPAFWREPVH